MTHAPLTSRERKMAAELRRLQSLLNEPMQTMEAIRKGEVDAFVISEDDEADQIFVLRSADRLHRQIVEAMGEGAVTLSPDGEITYCNPRFVQLMATPRDELLGRPLRDLVTAETRGALDAIVWSTNEEILRAELELSTASGPIPVGVVSSRLTDSDGAHLCLILSDLRDQRAREQMRAAKEAAELANRAKDDFLAVVSHELRSPITVILGWTRMLQLNRVDADTSTLAIESIHHSTARLLKLVDDILDASRLASGKVALHFDALDLRDSLNASLETVRFDIDHKQLAVVVHIPDEPVLVLGDADRLQQVIVNLLINAAKFTPAGGSIEIDLGLRDGDAYVRVTDTGEGIDPQFLPHVFERFRQDDNSTTRAHKGLGLGLAIVRQLVEAHGGSVTAHSDGKGAGAQFTVTLPLTTRPLKVETAARDEALPSLAEMRVLLVDDEPDTVRVMRSILESAGAVVDTATSVPQALAQAAAFTPHVIVTDIAMPGEDGFQFMRKLGEPSIPALAITGQGAAADREAILAAGFQRYLRKPIEPEELIRAVHGLARA